MVSCQAVCQGEGSFVGQGSPHGAPHSSLSPCLVLPSKGKAGPASRLCSNA